MGITGRVGAPVDIDRQHGRCIRQADGFISNVAVKWEVNMALP